MTINSNTTSDNDNSNTAANDNNNVSATFKVGANWFELPITAEVRKHGFSDISIINKDIFVTPDPTTVKIKSTSRIASRYYKGEVRKTVDAVLKKLKRIGFSEAAIDFIDFYLVDQLAAIGENEFTEQNQIEDREHNERQSIIDEIEVRRKQNNGNGTNNNEQPNEPLTFEKWQQTLNEKFQILHINIKDNMPEIWNGLEFELSILRILNIADCTLPFIGIILGRPSSGKTQIISLLKKWPYTYYTDNFTARAFVSHSTAVSSREELEEIDLLPKIRNKLFLTPELSPTFTAKDEDLNQLLGIITRIADGQGYQSDSGAHGHRGYDGELMFTWVGAAVDIPYKVYKLLGNLGAKLYFFRMPFENKTEDLLYTQINDDFNTKIKIVKDALFDYLKWFEICPDMIVDKSSSLLPHKINWNSEKDDEQAKRYIVRLAVLLSNLRCVAKTWETEDSQGSDYAYSVSQPEDPSRAVTMLTNLAKGHALLQGRNYIIKADISIVVKTVLSTAQIERVSLFSLLIENPEGELSSLRLLESLNVSKPTALRTMAEFKAIGLVNRQDLEVDGKKVVQINLKPEFRWFLSEEFKKLREGFTPTDYSKHLEEEETTEPVSIREQEEEEIAANSNELLLPYGIYNYNEQSQNVVYECYYCNEFSKTSDENEYKRHVIHKHFDKPAYPGRADLERLGLRPQNKSWEI